MPRKRSITSQGRGITRRTAQPQARAQVADSGAPGRSHRSPNAAIELKKSPSIRAFKGVKSAKRRQKSRTSSANQVYRLIGAAHRRRAQEALTAPEIINRLPPAHIPFLAKMGLELAVLDPDGTQMGRVSDPGTVARAVAAQAFDTASRWTEHLGGFYDVDGVRAVLSRTGKLVTKQAVSKRRGLLALTTGSGRVVYPQFQFASGSVLHGMDEVLRQLPEDLVSRWTVASWLVSKQEDLHGEAPVQLLREGAVAPVVVAAGDWARALAA